MPMPPATASVPAYTKNGARSEIAVSGPPIAGPAIAPSRNPDCHSPVALPRCSAGDDPEQQAHRGHGEHGRADAADPAQQQQLEVALREPGERAADRHDADAGGQDHPLAEPVDQLPAGQREHQSGEGERRDHRSGGGLADPEGPGEDGDRRAPPRRTRPPRRTPPRPAPPPRAGGRRRHGCAPADRTGAAPAIGRRPIEEDYRGDIGAWGLGCPNVRRHEGDRHRRRRVVSRRSSNGRHRRPGRLRQAAPAVATAAGSVAFVTTIGTAAFWLVPGDQRKPVRRLRPRLDRRCTADHGA